MTVELTAAVATLTLIVGMAVGASLMRRRLASTDESPFEELRDQVRAVARGERTSIDVISPDTDDLADAVNALSQGLRDNVARLRAETALREQVLSAMNEAVILLRGDDVVYANPAAHRLLGDPLDRVTGMIDTRTSTTTEVSLHHPWRREIRASAARLDDGTVLVVATDVTRARQTERMRRDFVANVSHELKTPLGGILATAETLNDAIDHDPEIAKRFAARIRIEADRLSRLVADLLDLARLEAPDAPTGERVDLTAAVREQIARYRAPADEKHIAVHVDLADGLFVRGRREDVTALPRNLIENAVHYTPAGGRIDVALGAVGAMAVLTVHDTGTGIASRDLGRVFERFYRADRARARDTGGTGLGLAIVKHAAESMGGSVDVESEPGAGSTFTVRLPLEPDAEAAAARG